MAALGFVSVEELASEIEKHHDSEMLRCQIADLRAKKIDLKKFCSNVRMMCGAQVLLDTVKGLQAKQKVKLATADSATASDDPKVPAIVKSEIKREVKPSISMGGTLPAQAVPAVAPDADPSRALSARQSALALCRALAVDARRLPQKLSEASCV